MIGTVTANPCIDKTVTVQNFDINATNRAEVVRLDCAGKGINVAKVLRAFGEDSICTGFDFSNGEKSALKTDLDALGINHDFLTLRGELRLCTKIFDSSRKHMIELNEYGSTVSPEDGEALIEKIKRVAKNCSFLTLSGSLPRGIDSDFYAKCVRAVRESAPTCRVIADCEGDLLRAALSESPYLIKPNIHEFESTFGCEIKSIEVLDATVFKLFESYGVEIVCVSLGGEGAYIADRKEAYFAKPAEVQVRSLQGAGDAMVAGISIALQKGLSIPDVLRYGIAASGATIATEGTLPGKQEHFEKLLKENIQIKKIR